MTQNERILAHLLSGRTITSKEAYDLYGCTRLSARIWDLRNGGYNIIGRRATAVNRFGDKVKFEEYSLVE